MYSQSVVVIVTSWCVHVDLETECIGCGVPHHYSVSQRVMPSVYCRLSFLLAHHSRVGSSGGCTARSVGAVPLQWRKHDMATKAIAVQAATPQDLETMTMQYISQGYVIANKSPAQVSLVKRKKINMTWLIIDLAFILVFGFGLLMLLITFIFYAMDNDKMVTITVVGWGASQTTGQLEPQSGSYTPY